MGKSRSYPSEYNGYLLHSMAPNPILYVSLRICMTTSGLLLNSLTKPLIEVAYFLRVESGS